MKKTFLVTVMMVATSLTAKAQTICAVMAEDKPSEYTKLVASKILDGSENNQVVYQDGAISYAATQKNTGDLSLMIYDSSKTKIYNAAISQKTQYLVLLSPDLHTTFTCSELVTRK